MGNEPGSLSEELVPKRCSHCVPDIDPNTRCYLGYEGARVTDTTKPVVQLELTGNRRHLSMLQLCQLAT